MCGSLGSGRRGGVRPDEDAETVCGSKRVASTPRRARTVRIWRHLSEFERYPRVTLDSRIFRDLGHLRDGRIMTITHLGDPKCRNFVHCPHATSPKWVRPSEEHPSGTPRQDQQPCPCLATPPSHPRPSAISAGRVLHAAGTTNERPETKPELHRVLRGSGRRLGGPTRTPPRALRAGTTPLDARASALRHRSRRVHPPANSLRSRLDLRALRLDTRPRVEVVERAGGGSAGERSLRLAVKARRAGVVRGGASHPRLNRTNPSVCRESSRAAGAYRYPSRRRAPRSIVVVPA